ncbi:PadR family transcriptional regulator [Traorella massiliensis]|uniref:PadR family transcriptional regulator n=1 Tax=Traorella massiliensis TaxID=1903263 RepID=UPI002352B9CF|nr:PadR family transcriptional regulator [Traorella massiliensis]
MKNDNKSNEMMKGFNDYFILALLDQHDSYGYEISKNIYEYTKGIYKIKESTLYTALQRLCTLKMIESYSGKETHGRSRTYYRITFDGKTYFSKRKIEVKDIIDSLKYFEGEGYGKD